MSRRYVRGEVITVDIGYGPHHYVVVSSDYRNKKLPSVLASRLTTKAKPDLDSVVPLDPTDRPLHGRVLCDTIVEIDHDEAKFKGRLTAQTMRRVNRGLLAALGLE